MDLSFSEEQNLLRDSVRKFIDNAYDFDSRRELLASENGFSRDHWRLFAELGWLGLPFSEDDGGLGGGPVELMILLQEFGRGLVLEPYLATVVLAGGLLRLAGSTEQKTASLPALIEGRLQLAFAHGEPQSRYDLADVATRAEATPDGFIIHGHKAVVFNGHSAEKLIVSARSSGAQRDRTGISLFLLDADAAGLSRRGYPTVDGLRAAEIVLDGVRVPSEALLGELNQAYPLIDQIADEACVALGAEAVGIMDVIVTSTLEYSKTREQFGQAIGKFQVLQHRLVDMFTETEQTKSLLYQAALRLHHPPAERRKAVSALKAALGEKGRFIGQQAIQIHGGMGVSDEMAISHYFKRLTMIDKMFGNTDYHLRRFSIQ